MNTYIVNWSIDIDAQNPQDAARQALEILRDTNSTATYFDVINTDTFAETSVDVSVLEA